jgi:plasmid maintenance system antidote protein VapI
METNPGFRHFLQDELLKRAKKNPSFSIRAFARQLGVEPSSLAQILGEKRKLTDRMCLRISERLGLSPKKVQTLMKREIPGASAENFQGFKKIQEDAFRVISDWYYYAILELTRTESFQGNVNWIASVLGLSTAEAHTAIERLKRLGYLKINEAGKWVDAMGSAHNLGNEYSAPAFREHQKQILKKAADALEQVEYDERVQSSMVLTGSRERVAEAKRKILNFIEELDEFMKTGPSRDEVYSISVSLFPLSKINSKPNLKKGSSK